MNDDIKSWYKLQFPKDKESKYISNTVTFGEVFNALGTYKNIYDIIGTNIGTVIRGRVFKRLADIMGVEYSYIYSQWMLWEDNK